MLVREIITEVKVKKTKKSKKQRRSAVYGPGAYGMYGTDAGYSGDAGVSESQLNEAIAMLPLLINLAADVTGVKAWIQTKVKEFVTNTFNKEDIDRYTQLDQAVASALGNEDLTMGSMLTMLLWNLVEQGNPMAAVLATVKQVGGELIKTQMARNLGTGANVSGAVGDLVARAPTSLSGAVKTVARTVAAEPAQQAITRLATGLIMGERFADAAEASINRAIASVTGQPQATQVAQADTVAEPTAAEPAV